MHKYVLRNKKVVVVNDLIEWGKELSSCDRRVDETNLPTGIRISTVFMGLDHSFGSGPPLLFETMVFGGKHDLHQERYSTWEEAEEGHKRIAKMVEATL